MANLDWNRARLGSSYEPDPSAVAQNLILERVRYRPAPSAGRVSLQKRAASLLEQAREARTQEATCRARADFHARQRAPLYRVCREAFAAGRSTSAHQATLAHHNQMVEHMSREAAKHAARAVELEKEARALRGQGGTGFFPRC